MTGFTTLFATRLYQARLGRALVRELERSCLALARDDGAGRRWSRAHGYKGYTSYASLDDLPRRDPAFAELAAALDRHVRIFARDAAFDLSGRKLVLDSLWVNVMAQSGVHAAHIHPHAVVSGTFYVAVPPGAGAIRFEDPRLAMMMAAPGETPRTSIINAPEPTNAFAPPPKVLESDSERKAATNNRMPEVANVPFIDAGAPAPPPAPIPPQQACNDKCGGDYKTCATGCEGDAGPKSKACRACESTYKTCMRGCFK